jgi:hypothetical protein
MSRHLDALERREPGAAADVAAALRTLLTHGDGNDVIRRLCRTTNTALPQVLITQSAADHRDVVLSVGALPTSPQDETVSAGISRPQFLVDIDQWMNKRALVIRHGRPRRANNWHHVTSMYANSRGSHLSGTFPEILSQMSVVTSDRLDLGQYLIHSAGTAAESLLNQVLAEVSGKPVIELHKAGRHLNPLVGLSLYSDAGTGPAVQPEILGIHLPVEREVDVVKLHYEDRCIKASYIRDTNDKVDGNLVWSQSKPVWWDIP